MPYITGPTGPTGIAGTQGLQGGCGPLGPALGPTGLRFSQGNTARLNIVPAATSPITLDPNIATIYNFIANGDVTVTAPSLLLPYPPVELSGIHWIFHNNTSFYITLTFTGGYNTSYSLPVGQSVILVLFVDSNGTGTYSLL